MKKSLSLFLSLFLFSLSFAETVKVLENIWQRRIELSYYDLDSLPQAVRDKKLDYFISNPGIFSHMQLLGQARHLATLKIAQADDPNFSLGGVFFVRSDDEQIRTFEDMRGKSALAVAPNAFGGLAVHLGEIRARGYDPEHFFASISYTGYPMQSVLEQMRQGRSRVGMVRTCLIEEMTAKGLLAKDEFRVIGAKNDPRLRCSTSTELYPDWVFAATTEAKPEQSRQACAALFSLSDEMGGYWTQVAAYSKGHGHLFCTVEGYRPCHNAAEVIADIGYDADFACAATAASSVLGPIIPPSTSPPITKSYPALAKCVASSDASI